VATGSVRKLPSGHHDELVWLRRVRTDENPDALRVSGAIKRLAVVVPPRRVSKLDPIPVLRNRDQIDVPFDRSGLGVDASLQFYNGGIVEHETSRMIHELGELHVLGRAA